MFKHFALLSLLISLIFVSECVQARAKKKKPHSVSAKAFKPSKHKRKSRRYTSNSHRRNSNGLDLKKITTDSPYKEDPNNGVNLIETKQPAI